MHGHDFWSMCKAALSIDSYSSRIWVEENDGMCFHILYWTRISEKPGTICAPPHISEVSAGTHILAEIHD